MTGEKIVGDVLLTENYRAWGRASGVLEEARNTTRAQVLAAIHDGNDDLAAWATQALVGLALAYEYVDYRPPVEPSK
jgi:hypothetical protein